MTPESLFELQTVTAPLSLKDGSVFYLKTSISKEENKYPVELYRYLPDEKKHIAYGAEGHTYQQLTLSPNGQSISYLSKADDKMQVFSQPVAGGRPVQLTHEKENIAEFIWSKNDKKIYYVTSKDKDASEVKDEKDDKKLPTATHSTWIMHKMDGGSFVKENQIFELKELSLKNQTDSEILYSTEHGFSLIDMTTDEKTFYIRADKDVDNEWDWGAAIYELDTIRGEVKELTNPLLDNGRFYDMLLNKDGDEALLLGNDFSHAFVTLNNLYHYKIGEKNLVNVTEKLDYDLGEAIVDDGQQNMQSFPVAHWLTDDSFIFEVGHQANTALYTGNTDGELHIVFNKPLRLTGISWGDISGLDEKIWVTYSTFTQLSQLGQLDLATGELTSVYNPNETFEKEYKIVDPERFWVETAPGQKIQGWYLPPVDAMDPYPAILNIHGGPQVNFGESFFHEMQVLAASGYGVIMLNPRGGSGYGQEFVASILGAYGSVDYDDLMNGLDYVISEHPEIDQDRVYVTGGSYGGFMTNWVVTHTDRFKAAATQRSICNWISFYGTSDIGPHFVEKQLQRDLSDIEGLWELSPLAYADHLTTPLLVLHGQQDHRCPQEQAEQMYRAALKQGIDTKLVTFPESSHGLSREGLPNLRIERLNELLNWFDSHK